MVTTTAAPPGGHRLGGAETPKPPGRGRGDEVLRAARAALAAATIPGVRLAIVTGRAVADADSLSAGLIDRGLAEVRRSHGDVRVDETTARLLEGRFGVEGQKGERVLPVVSPPPDDFGPRLLGRPAPLVGREREVAALVALVEACVSAPAARGLLVTGPPGAGKSRLLYELTRRAEASATAARVLHARGEEPGAPFGMIGAALRGVAGQRCGWHAWLASECARRPVILVLEDLHWGDAPSVSFVDAALRAAKGRPLLVLAAARPEVHERFPGLFAGRDLEERRLGPLTRKASERLVRKALGPEVDDGVVRRLVDGAAGNALHLEELVRGVAAGFADALPETLAGMVQARVDALGSEARRLLLAAGVLGRTFWPGAVSALMGEGSAERTREIVAGLEAAELVVRRRESRIPGEIEYDFAHAVVHDAAYAALIPDGSRPRPSPRRGLAVRPRRRRRRGPRRALRSWWRPRRGAPARAPRRGARPRGRARSAAEWIGRDRAPLKHWAQLWIFLGAGESIAPRCHSVAAIAPRSDAMAAASAAPVGALAAVALAGPGEWLSRSLACGCASPPACGPASC